MAAGSHKRTRLPVLYCCTNVAQVSRAAAQHLRDRAQPWCTLALLPLFVATAVSRVCKQPLYSAAWRNRRAGRTAWLPLDARGDVNNKRVQTATLAGCA